MSNSDPSRLSDPASRVRRSFSSSSSPTASPGLPSAVGVSPLLLEAVSRSLGGQPDADTPFSPRGIQCVGNYDLGKTIGRGQFGKVKLARHVLTGEKVAVKIIRKRKLDPETMKLIRREIYIMKMLEHSHIIRLYEVLETQRVLFLIMEYASGGEALDFVIAKGKMSEERARKLFRQVLHAVSYCHKRSVCHRDLKAENILLDADLNAKVIDFGFARIFDRSSLLGTYCGSPTYAAPELVKREPYEGPPVDVWSMGVLLFVLVTGKLPFESTDFKELYAKILSADYEIPDFVSPDCADIIRRMLTVDPAQRATSSELRRHRWLKVKRPPRSSTSASPKSLADSAVRRGVSSEQLNQSVLDQMSLLGFSERQVKESISGDSYDSAAGTYRLLVDKMVRSCPGSPDGVPRFLPSSVSLDAVASAPLPPNELGPSSFERHASAPAAESRPEWTEDMSNFLKCCASQPGSAATSPDRSPVHSPRAFASVRVGGGGGEAHRARRATDVAEVARKLQAQRDTEAAKREIVAQRKKRIAEKKGRRNTVGHKRSNSETLASLAQILQKQKEAQKQTPPPQQPAEHVSSEGSESSEATPICSPTYDSFDAMELMRRYPDGSQVIDFAASMPASPMGSPPLTGQYPELHFSDSLVLEGSVGRDGMDGMNGMEGVDGGIDGIKGDEGQDGGGCDGKHGEPGLLGSSLLQKPKKHRRSHSMELGAAAVGRDVPVAKKETQRRDPTTQPLLTVSQSPERSSCWSIKVSSSPGDKAVSPLISRLRESAGEDGAVTEEEDEEEVVPLCVGDDEADSQRTLAVGHAAHPPSGSALLVGASSALLGSASVPLVSRGALAMSGVRRNSNPVPHQAGSLGAAAAGRRQRVNSVAGVARQRPSSLAQVQRVESPSPMRRQHSDGECRRPPSPRGFDELLLEIKSMISSSQEEDNRGEPRVGNIKTCPNSLTSMKTPDEIVVELERVFGEFGLRHEREGSCAVVAMDLATGLEFWAEVCRMPNLKETYLVHLRRIAGEWNAFQAMYLKLSAAVNL